MWRSLWFWLLLLALGILVVLVFMRQKATGGVAPANIPQKLPSSVGGDVGSAGGSPAGAGLWATIAGFADRWTGNSILGDDGGQ